MRAVIGCVVMALSDTQAKDNSMQAIIEVDQVDKSFGPQRVLQQLSLQVPAGSVYGFLGNNGAGKSTLMRLLLGLLSPDRGEIRVLGVRPSLKVRRHIGCIVDAPALYGHLTVTEFLRLCASLKQVHPTDISRVLQLVDLSQASGQRICKLSLGMKQRLALANAMLGTPALLLLDEPTNGLDPVGMQAMNSLIKAMPAQTGCTVLVSSHLLDEVEKIASHIGILQQGRLAFSGTLSALAAQAPRLLLQVGEPERALQWLRTKQYQVALQQDGWLSLQGIQPQQLAVLHRELIQQGIALYQSTFHQPGLTEVFHQLNRSQAS